MLRSLRRRSAVAAATLWLAAATLWLAEGRGAAVSRVRGVLGVGRDAGGATGARHVVESERKRRGGEDRRWLRAAVRGAEGRRRVLHRLVALVDRQRRHAARLVLLVPAHAREGRPGDLDEPARVGDPEGGDGGRRGAAPRRCRSGAILVVDVDVRREGRLLHGREAEAQGHARVGGVGERATGGPLALVARCNPNYGKHVLFLVKRI